MCNEQKVVMDLEP